MPVLSVAKVAGTPLGITLASTDDVTAVSSVDPSGPCARAGISVGMVITHVNGVKVSSAPQCTSLLKQAQEGHISVELVVGKPARILNTAKLQVAFCNALIVYSCLSFCGNVSSEDQQHLDSSVASALIAFYCALTIAALEHLWRCILAHSVSPHAKPLTAEDDCNTMASAKVCGKCLRHKPDRVHHCSRCNACVDRMDHHCNWVDNCVGQGNYADFLLLVVELSLMAALFACACLVRVVGGGTTASFGLPTFGPSWLMLSLWAGGTLALLSRCLCLHVRLLSAEMTTLEYLEKQSILYRTLGTNPDTGSALRSALSSFQATFAGRLSVTSLPASAAWYGILLLYERSSSARAIMAALSRY